MASLSLRENPGFGTFYRILRPHSNETQNTPDGRAVIDARECSFFLGLPGSNDVSFLLQ